MQSPNVKDLAYWINERWAVRQRRAAGLPAPWSGDAVFRTVRFCNVHREDDRVTRWVRLNWNRPTDPAWRFVVARMINWPDSLGTVMDCDTPEEMKHGLLAYEAAGRKVFTSAYTISTCGRKMNKLDYVFDHVVRAVHGGVAPDYTTLESAAADLQWVDGLGSFLTGQVLADMKNTDGHPLQRAADWWTFSLPGPGSLRGLSWFWHGRPTGETAAGYAESIADCRALVDPHIHPDVPRISDQDFQNCLCEFSKWCKVTYADGRVRNKFVPHRVA